MGINMDSERTNNNTIKWISRIAILYFIIGWLTGTLAISFSFIIVNLIKLIIIYYIFRTIYCIIKSILLTLFDILRYGWMSDDTSAYIGEHLLWWIPDGSGSSKSSDTSFYVGYYDGKPISFLKWW